MKCWFVLSFDLSSARWSPRCINVRSPLTVHKCHVIQCTHHVIRACVNVIACLNVRQTLVRFPSHHGRHSDVVSTAVNATNRIRWADVIAANSLREYYCGMLLSLSSPNVLNPCAVQQQSIWALYQFLSPFVVRPAVSAKKHSGVIFERADIRIEMQWYL